jgi:hypothetical protein
MSLPEERIGKALMWSFHQLLSFSFVSFNSLSSLRPSVVVNVLRPPPKENKQRSKRFDDEDVNASLCA